jgi:trigger factor
MPLKLSAPATLKDNVLNVQTEPLQNHTARMVVEVDPDRLAKAKNAAAQKISKQLNIPGFRKGKAPYRVVAQWVGENSIVDEAMEIVSNDVYKAALEETTLQPYGPGEVEKYELDPAPTLFFTVPLQPTVDLKDYRSVRVDYEIPTVDDETVDRYFKRLRHQFALIEPSQKPAAMGDEVTIDIHSHFVAEGEEGEHTHDHDEEGHDHDHNEGYIHEHDMPYVLEVEDDLAPGFSEALVGVEAGQTRDFVLTIGEDNAEHAGRKVHFVVGIKKVQTVTLPALNDDFAARVTESEEKPLTLLELRVRTRENLEKANAQVGDDAYAEKVLEQIVAGADIGYPEALINDEIDSMLQRLDQRLRENKLTLRDYMNIYRKTPQDMIAESKPTAERNIRRALVMRQIGIAERLDITDEELEAELGRMLGTVSEGEQTNARALLQHPAMRDQVRENQMRERILERVVAIGKGEAPELTEVEAEAEVQETSEG